MTEKYYFAQNIMCHAWSKDKKEIAISPNSNELEVYKKTGADWSLTDSLKQHDLIIKSVDWAPKTNRIVTCSMDRNAYVWTLENGKWKPMLVLLRLNRAATFVKWSPEENKFAVGSGDKLVAICYFEKENNWWVSKHIKKPIKSTVTTLDWHPNNVLIATGSTDYRVRVFSAYIKDIEPQPSSTAWGSKMPLAQLIVEVKNSKNGGGWIHSVSFSGDGNKVCWVAHDSSVNVIDASNPQNVIKLKTKFAPFLSIIWTSPNTLVAAGHDYTPLVFTVQDKKITHSGKFKTEEKKTKSKITAMERFRQIDLTGSVEDSSIKSVHQNLIKEISIYEGVKGNVKKIATSGIDGQLVIWNLSDVVKA